MSYQFFHIEAYSLVAKSYEREITIKKGSKAGQTETKKTETRSLKEIMEEQALKRLAPMLRTLVALGSCMGCPPWRFYLLQRNGQTRRKMPGATK